MRWIAADGSIERKKGNSDDSDSDFMVDTVYPMKAHSLPIASVYCPEITETERASDRKVNIPVGIKMSERALIRQLK